jgi:isoquinoline 1-oxidoreductase beta subunit
LKIERVVCAVDCGVAVNPDVVAAQMESGIAYGLSAALSGAITISDGMVDQSNFHDYQVLRAAQMPRIDVAIVPSKENPTGVGEPSTPVIAPALANAVLALEGKPVRTLPLSAQDLRFA